MGIQSRNGVVATIALLTAGACGARPADGKRTKAVAEPTQGAVQATAAPRADQPAGPAVAVSAVAGKTLTALRARGAVDSALASGLADGFHQVGEGMRPHFPAAAEAARAAVTFPKRATSPITIVDSASGVGVDVAIKGARKVDAEIADGYVVYRNAHVSGATLLHRALPDGEEDFVVFDARPRTASVSYKIALRDGVAGLRLVSGSLEMLDAGGAPRLRTAFPFIIGADGARTDAVLSVEGCAVDRSPAGPWGRKVTAPGARSCTVRVSWDDAGVEYPAVLDPKWTTTTNSMVSARQDHTATFLPATGKVLVVGGRTSGTSTTGLTTADLFDPATSTWSPTGSLGTGNGRWSHTAIQLNTGSNANTSGRVLVAGGINGTTSVTTWHLYNVTTGTFSASLGSIGVARHLHTATLLGNSNVLVAGGMTNTAAIGSAAIYNPGGTSNGTWTPVSTNMATRRFHTATFLTSSNSAFNNKVLMLGGNSGGSTTVTTFQLFDQATSTWSMATALPAAVVREGHTATRLANGNVLLTGGKNGTAAPLQDSFVFTIPTSGSTPTFPSAGMLTARRWGHTATLLSTAVLGNGQVLLAGGSSDGTTSIATAELWNGTAWSATTSLLNPRRAHTATLLASGKVLVAGGINSTTFNNGQVYDPSTGIACTTGTQCASGFCVNGVCCDSACTNQCQACNLTGSVGTCSNKANGTGCNDSNACTQADTCQTGTCTGANPVVCTASDQCHNVGTCNTGTGVCSNPAKANGTACNDANACTQTDTCQSGNCTGSNPVVCMATDQCHDVGTCNTGTGVCSNPAKANGTACNDANACTQSDTCQSGNCTGSNPVVCTASDQCHDAGTCNTGTGVCSNPVKADGTACNDANVCTQMDTCQAGICTGSAPVTCTASDQCHDAGACDPATGQCSNPVKLDQAAGPLWTNKAPMATPRFGAAGIAYGGLTYLFGGCTQPPCGNDVTATSEAYDPIQNAWSARAPMPTARDVAAAATINGIIYVVGGYRGTASDLPLGTATVEAYDPVNDSWTTRASMHVGRHSPAIGVIGGKLYVAGGHCCADHGVIPPDFVDSYDPATDTWTARGPVPTERNAPAYGVIGGKLYVAGGLKPDRTLVDTLEAYDPTTDSWTSLRRMPSLLATPGATVMDGKLYVIGGSTASSTLPNVTFDQVYIYDPATDSWSVGPAMTNPRYGTVATVDGERILVAGGYTATGPTTAVQSLSALRGPACSDGAACTQGEMCSAGSCQPPANPYPVVLNLPVEDLGSLGTQSAAYGINNSGTVVGNSTGLDGVVHASRWSPPGPLVNLETELQLSAPSAAQAINDSGTVVGYQTLADVAHAFRAVGSSVDEIATPSDGSATWEWGTYLRGAYPTAINDAGAVAGYYTYAGTIRGFRFTDGEGTEEVPSLVADGRTLMNGIAASGTAVGSSRMDKNDPSSMHAVLYDNSLVGLRDLNDIADVPEGVTLMDATSIAGNYIVGYGWRDGASYVAFRWNRATGALDVIDGGWLSNWAWNVNASGDFVGAGAVDVANATASIGSGFVFTDQLGFKKLDDLIPQDSSWNLRRAQAINASGEIVGWGYHAGTGGDPRPYRLQLPPGQAATCQARNVCASDSDTICLFSDGVVETSQGHFVAVFGFDNASSTTVHPTVNEVHAIPVADIHPAPPADLSPGTHFGAYLPSFDEGQTISWTVNGETVTASAASPRAAGIFPALVGIADDSAGVTKAIFTYWSASPVSVTIPYGAENSLSDQNGFIGAPPQRPTQVFVPEAHAPFVATLGSNQLTWKVRGRSVTATSQSARLPVTTLPDGTVVATLPDGRKFNLDSLPPNDPTPASEPDLGERFYGALAGKLSVSPSGAATYTVPIAIPPGIAGMAPNLSLVYSSQGGDGLAGQGWDLAGLSTIHRCAKTRVQDGYSRPISMSSFESPPPGVPPPRGFEQSHDALCIDGKRMFQGADGKYHLEGEDFSVITAHADINGTVSPLFFTVETKTGEKRYYGLNPKARVQFPHHDVVHGDTTETAIWALDRVIDAWGNYFDVQYNDDSGDFSERGLIVTKIGYTGHLLTTRPGGGSYQPAFPPFHTITFGYGEGTRPDVRRARFADATLPRVKRLTSITTPLGTYRLLYINDTDPTLPSRMSRIEYCATGGAPCLDPLNFMWDGGGYGWEQQPRPETAGGQANSYVLPTAIDSPIQCDSEMEPLCWPHLPGTQFVDLNADGRPDLVKSIAASDTPNAPQTSLAWINNGYGWTADSTVALPAGLVDGNGRIIGTSFADMDGDGVLDLVTRENRTCGCPPGCTECPGVLLCQVTCPPRKPVVYYNRRNGWEPDVGVLGSPSGASTYPVGGWGEINFAAGTDQLADMNADGRTDIVRVSNNSVDADPAAVRVLINTPGVGWVEDTQTHYFVPVQVFQGQASRPARFADINRDGLSDVLTRNGGLALLNMGANDNNGAGSVWGGTFTGPGNSLAPSGTRFSGDVDGDGYHDSVSLFESVGTPVGTGVFFSAGGLGYTTSGPTGYLASLAPFEPPHDPHRWANFAMTDLNADGLTDLVMASPLYHDHTTEGSPSGPAFINNSGNVMINTGTSWAPYNPGLVVGPVPVVPMDVHSPIDDPLTSHVEEPFTSSNGAAFIDLNGDGVPDLVQNSSYGNVQRTWLNTFKPPVIKAFPNGVAQQTRVEYEVITTARAKSQSIYVDDTPVLEAGTTYFMAPLRVVESMSADDGLGTQSLAKTSYRYISLRGSAIGRGPQGFREVVAHDERSGFIVRSDYYQAFPYTGLPKEVLKFKAGVFGGTISRTATTYCDTIEDQGQGPLCSPPSGATSDPPATSRFIYPLVVLDEAWAGTSPTITTESQFRYDGAGNPIKTLVRITSRTGEQYEKLTVNEYAATPVIPLRLGKLTQSAVTSRRLVPFDALGTMTVQHLTAFDYASVGDYADPAAGGQNNAIRALTKRRLEPNANQTNDLTKNTELHTAFDYDGVGNVVLTKDCATAFNTCDADPGNVGPPDLPHRTTTVSYDPTAFSPPSGQGLITALSYEPGRFPVMTTNAVGHKEYSAFDPTTGFLRQRTGPNGITTCYTSDAFGQQESETVRCGSENPLTTTTVQYRNANVDLPLAKVVAVTTPPTGDVVWTYSDALGRKIDSRRRGFDGRFVGSTTVYDTEGRAATEHKPHFLGDPIFTVDKTYDALSRVRTITQSLGQIAPSGGTAQSSLLNTYQGLTNSIDETVGTKTRHHSETKNALGKTSAVTDRIFRVDPNDIDAHDVTTYYSYDGDGNLRFVGDPAGNTIETLYDVRGRKIRTRDPDMGTWSYVYNGYGDLVSQVDAKNQTTTMTYDNLGRMVTKTDSQGTAEWIYDRDLGGKGKLTAMISAPDPRLTLPCTIPYASLTSGNRVGRSFKYSKFGELEEVTDCAEGTDFVTTYKYDAKGRQTSIQYPDVNGQRLVVGYHYTSLGYLHYLTDDSGDYSVFWQATSMNALDQVTGEVMRNGVENLTDRNPATGWMMATSSTAHRDGDKLIQNWAYGYDEAGNLLSRGRSDQASPPPSLETFTYDSLNRVRTSRVTVALENYDVPEAFDYDDLGNLTAKGGATYAYNSGCLAGVLPARPAGPHAVCTVGTGSPYSYDANGNMLSGGGRSLEYNALNKVDHMQGPGGQVDFIYGADGNRVIQDTGPQGDRTVYVGLGATGRSVYERTTGSSGTQHVHFIYAGGAHGGNPFALRIVAADGSTTGTKYYSFDHLGSVTALSNETGQVATAEPGADVLGYDPWGARRHPDGRAADSASFSQPPGHREFTGHETIPNLGLVNMNGRVYDPVLGRFLSPDPNVQFAANLQSYNRYSYVLNNPLRSTDPTGFLLDEWTGVSGMDFSVGWTLAIGGYAICAAYGPASGGAACVVSAGINAAWQAAVAQSHGGSFGLTLAVNAVSMYVGYVAGGASFGLGPAADASQFEWDLYHFRNAVISGALSGATSRIISSAVVGGDLSGTDLLMSAAQGAAMSAASWGMNDTPVSKASARDGGTGEAKLEKGLVLRMPAAAGYCNKSGWCGSSTVIPDDGPGPLGTPLLRDPIAGLQDAVRTFRADRPLGWQLGVPVLGGSLPGPGLFVQGAAARGVLSTGRAEIELASGARGGPPALPFPGRNSTNFFHVEAHSAQIMRLENLESATLRINRIPCAVGPGCANSLPSLLPEGARLRILGPGGYDKTFIGLPDPPGYPR